MSDPHHQKAEQEKGLIGLAKLEGNGREGSESRLPNLRAGEERTELLPSRITEDEVFWGKDGKVKMCKNHGHHHQQVLAGKHEWQEREEKEEKPVCSNSLAKMPTENEEVDDIASRHQHQSALSMPCSDEGKNATLQSRRTSSMDRGPKLAKFFTFWEQFNLGNGFRIFGHFVGTYPMAFLISSLILASLSFGMYKMEVKDRVRDGYTPSTSLARYETDVLKEFLGSTGDPLVTTVNTVDLLFRQIPFNLNSQVMLRARDGGSMHRIRWLDESVRLHNFLRRNISAELEGEVK
jgi:hypothetical protein